MIYDPHSGHLQKILLGPFSCPSPISTQHIFNATDVFRTRIQKERIVLYIEILGVLLILPSEEKLFTKLLKRKISRGEIEEIIFRHICGVKHDTRKKKESWLF